ncbi:hypothetical protein [Halorussus marinus]|uniref:hypothetical protein n=1 Tax=Halorussus marinus TaxID=2505976 RepID=UPI00106DF027|nr:hypothetical protein [Halorussus marinus]
MGIDEFEPKRLESPPEEIVPERSLDLKFEDAQEVCKRVIDRLPSDISGIGPKAVERYLLRSEFGFDTAELIEAFDITQSTLSKQTNQVHRKVLKYPFLARVIGGIRSDRAGVSPPEQIDRTLWEESLEINSKTVHTIVNYTLGGISSPYSWKVSLRADSETEDQTRHHRSDYLIDAEYGVLLKRSLRGISDDDWGGKQHFQQLRTYLVYPLPHPEIVTTDGSLVESLQYHVSHDIKSTFTKTDWKSIERRIRLAEAGDLINPHFAEQGLSETIHPGIGVHKQIDKYTNETRLQDNLEHLLRHYPLTRVEQIPANTIDLIWNSPITDVEDFVEEMTRTSQVMYEPGHRTLWSLR